MFLRDKESILLLLTLATLFVIIGSFIALLLSYKP